jgi:membrane-associated protein
VEFLEKLLEIIRNPASLFVGADVTVYGVVALIVFAETGALVFFLPGDSLLVTAGLYAAQGSVNVWILNAVLVPAAILGGVSSYWIGRKTGPALFNKPKSRFFDPKHVIAAKEFYEKHGGKAIVIARFMPIVRTFVPIVAGIGGMEPRRYHVYNAVGAILWVTSLTVVGYVLGAQVPEIGKHIEKVIIVVVVVSMLPGLIAWIRAKMRARAADKAAKAAE